MSINLCLHLRQVEARKIAVGGYLLLLRKFKVNAYCLASWMSAMTLGLASWMSAMTLVLFQVLDPVGVGMSGSQTSQTFSGSQVGLPPPTCLDTSTIVKQRRKHNSNSLTDHPPLPPGSGTSGGPCTWTELSCWERGSLSGNSR